MKPEHVAMLETIDRDIAGHEEQLAKLRQGRAVLADLWGEQSPSLPAPATAAVRQSTTRAAVTRKATRGRKGANTLAQDVEAALAWCAKRSMPARMVDLVAALKIPRRRATLAVDELVRSGKLVRAGKTSGVRVGVPAVMAAAAKEDL